MCLTVINVIKSRSGGVARRDVSGDCIQHNERDLECGVHG